jgi:excinuclease ABC subunit C
MISITDPSQFNGSEIPVEPGVYLFKNDIGTVLYVGKAKNLRSRIRFYFSSSNHAHKTQRLIPQIRDIDWIIVGNEVEALLLENKLVKQHMPKYNVNLKDAKSYAYIALSKESYPRLLTSRRASSKWETFGPYTDGYMRRELHRLVIKLFKIRVCKKLPRKACLNFHIGLCTAPCTGYVTQEQYTEQVSQARAFLLGNYEQITEALTAQMQKASMDKAYERALELRNQLASIQLLTQRQVVDGHRGYDQDVVAFRRLGENVLVVQLGVRRGVLLGKREYSVDFEPQVEQEFLKKFYITQQIPREILLNTTAWSNHEEKATLEAYFSTVRGGPVALTVPEGGDELRLIKLAAKNIEANLDKDSALVDLQTALSLPTLPRIIECFDVSNLGKEHVVSGMVRFMDGKPDTRNYRRFRIKKVEGQDDFASMKEAVTRRYTRLSNKNAPLPDLVVVDGGSAQVSAAGQALKSLGLQISLIGLAKEREEIFLPEEAIPRRFNKSSRMMLLLRRIRDSAHRFAVRYNRKRRHMKIRDEFKIK